MEPPLNDDEIRHIRYLIRKDQQEQADREWADTIPAEDEF